MSTRGIVAVATETSWSGFELQADAHPAAAGTELLRLMREHGLVELCRRTRQARLFPAMRVRATPASHALRADLQWAYVIDPAARTLCVFAAGIAVSPHAPRLIGNWSEVSVHAIGADGTCDPPSMADVRTATPWPMLAVAETWELERPADTALAATERLELRREVDRACAAAGVTVATVMPRIATALAAALTAPFGGPKPSRVFVTMPWTAGSFYWRVRLGDLELMYPATASCRHGALTTTSEGRDELVLFAEPERTVTIDSRPTAMLSRAADRDVVRAAVPGTAWLFAICDLLRAGQLADGRGEDIEREKIPARLADDWEVLVHPDGRVWSIRRSTNGYQLRLGSPSDDPVYKERSGNMAAYDALIQEQLADGFVRR